MNSSQLATVCEELKDGASIGSTLHVARLPLSVSGLDDPSRRRSGDTVAYRAISAEGSRQFLTERIEWKGDKAETHAYPLPTGEGMEDGGFEIEIYLPEKLDTNLFEFAMEGADDLDFFHQPEFPADEIAQGAVRP